MTETGGFELRHDKQAIKQGMSISSVYDYLSSIRGVSGQWVSEEILLFETCCHNHIGEGTHKLYYYDNTKLFNCYTGCGSNFDIFELINKMNVIETGEELELEDSIKKFVYSQSFLFAGEQEFGEELDDEKEYVKPTILGFDKSILQHYKPVIVDNWTREGITEATQRKFGLRLNTINMSAIFPHFDEFHNLYGVRQRMLSGDNVERFGKYRPLERADILYSTPLSFYLFGLNNSGMNIRVVQKAVVYEGEKSCMKMDSILGPENNISVASFGMKFSRHQFEILKGMGVKEIIFAFDRQFKQVKDDEFYLLIDTYRKINNRFKDQGVELSFILDDELITSYKDSPIDKGYDVFATLYGKKRSMEKILDKFQKELVPPEEWTQPELDEEDIF